MIRDLRWMLPLAAVLCSSPAQGQAIDHVENGDFSAGNVGFVTEYLNGNCFNGGNYQVLADPNDCHGSWQGSDHTTGSGNFMVVNGSGRAGTLVWGRTMPVVPHESYTFRLHLCGVYTSSPARLSISINGVEVGIATAPRDLFTWTEFSAVWDSGDAGEADVRIVDLNTASGGNDFGLDDISFVGPAPVGTRPASWGRLKLRYR